MNVKSRVRALRRGSFYAAINRKRREAPHPHLRLAYRILVPCYALTKWLKSAGQSKTGAA